MKSFWSLIPRNIFKNKKRIVSIAISIILSMSLIIALSVMLDILKKSSYERMVDDAGGVYDIQFYTSDAKALDTFSKDPIINKTSIGINLGINEIPKTKYTVEINGYEKNIPEFINFKLVQGRYPEKDNEIAVEDWILDKLPQKYKLGDEITLPSALFYTNSKGKPVNLNIENKFILVGTFKYTYNQNGEKNNATAYVTRKYVQSKLPAEAIKYFGYSSINNEHSLDKGLELLIMTDQYQKISININIMKEYLPKRFKIIDFISAVLYLIISIVAGIIIYNIFNILITERIKEFGMLRAIGSSPGQIKMLVLGEGIILGCIFIPIGIILGNFIIKGMIILISGYKDVRGIMDIPGSGIIASVIVGFLSILMGTYSPAGRASRISPVEAISSNNNLKLTGSSIKKNLQKKSYMGKLFGFTADMAYLNVNRNKKRFITTVISLSISIIMFLAVSYLIYCADPIKNLKNEMGGDFVITSASISRKKALTDKDIKDIENIKGIGKISKEKNVMSIMKVPEGKVTDYGIKFLRKEANKTPSAKQQFEQKIYSFHSTVYGLAVEDFSSIKDYVAQGEIDTDKMDKEPLVILAQNLNYTSYTKLNVGDRIKLTHSNYDDDGNFINETDETFIIGAILDNDFISPDPLLNNFVFMSSKTAEEYMKISGYQEIKINLSKNANYDETEKILKEKIKKDRYASLTSYKEELEKIKKNNLQTSLILYSFVSAVAVFSIINLFNIMTMNVMIRKREIGMFRAMGFENNQVKKMIRFEGVFYGVTSAVWGIGLGVIFTYILYLLARKSLMQGMTWSFPIITVIITFAATVFICIMASINASRTLFESSIVDSIRNNE
ncbi:MAG: FtsX-like permease family protein [Bacillota bacterium]|nr:FtsX-like permease family protein [Bacillota bacterium]